MLEGVTTAELNKDVSDAVICRIASYESGVNIAGYIVIIQNKTGKIT
jgi:hypothetical protein